MAMTDKNGREIRHGDKVVVDRHGGGTVICVNDANSAMAVTVVLEAKNEEGGDESVCVPAAQVEVK